MAKEKKERAKNYEPKIKHNLGFNEIMKIAANPKPKEHKNKKAAK